MKAIFTFMLMATVALAELPVGEQPALDAAVAAAWAAGKRDTVAILEALIVPQKTGGTTNVVQVLPRPARVIEIELGLIQLYTNQGFAADAKMQDIVDAYLALPSPSTAIQQKFQGVTMNWIELRDLGGRPNAMTGYSAITNTVQRPVYAAPVWSGSAINGRDIEASMRRLGH